MSFWVYILHCVDGSYYTGHTDNLEKRMHEHRTGIYSGYTVSRRPVELVFCQPHTTREEALASEQKIKGWSRRKKEAMIQGDWKAVHEAARKNFKRRTN